MRNTLTCQHKEVHTIHQIDRNVLCLNQFSNYFYYVFQAWPSKRPRVKRVALFPGRAGDKSAEHVASFNEQRDPQAKPAVLQYFGKTAVNNKSYAPRHE